VLRPIRDSVLFVFKEEVNSGMFVENSESGIYLGKSMDASSSEARWAVVAAIAPEVKSVKPGDKVLIAALRWTEGFKIDNNQLWKTVEKEILAVDTEAGIKLTPPENTIFFIKDKRKGTVTQSDAGVYVVASNQAGDDVCWGTVKAVGPDVNVDDVVVGSRVLARIDTIDKFLKTEDGDVYKVSEDNVIAIEETV
jgi:hypothetical protein